MWNQVYSLLYRMSIAFLQLWLARVNILAWERLHQRVEALDQQSVLGFPLRLLPYGLDRRLGVQHGIPLRAVRVQIFILKQQRGQVPGGNGTPQSRTAGTGIGVTRQARPPGGFGRELAI